MFLPLASILLFSTLSFAQGKASYYEYPVPSYRYDYPSYRYTAPIVRYKSYSNDNNVYITDKYGQVVSVKSAYDNYYPKSYYTSPYVDRRYYGRSYKNYPEYYNDDKVYITDMYGRTTAVSKYRYDYERSRELDPCKPNPCGPNTICKRSLSGIAVCSCLENFYGSPSKGCKKSECVSNGDCPSNTSCIDGKCINVCINMCGKNAICSYKNHIPACSCPSGFNGDPFNACRKILV